MSTSIEVKTSRKIPKLLFAVPDTEFQVRLNEQAGAKITRPLVVGQGSEAMSAITNTKLDLAAIFLALEIEQPDFHTILKASKQFRKGVPIFLIHADPKSTDVMDRLQDWGIDKIYPMTLQYDEVIREFFPPAILFNLQAAVERAAANPHGVEQEIAAPADEFVTIPVHHVLSNFKTFFDLYIRTDSGHMMKVFKAGDVVDSDRLQKFAEKGLQEFWYRREDEQDFLALNDRLVTRLNELETVSPELKITQTYAFGNQTARYLKRFEALKGEQVQYALSYVDRLNQLVDQMALSKQSVLIQRVMSDVSNNDHVIGVASVASILAHQAGLETQKSLRTVGIAALFHDIGLPPEFDHLNYKTESEMTSEELKIYHAHPSRGSKTLGLVRGIDPVVCQMVGLHHRRKNGSGFPNAAGIGLSAITLPVEIIGAAEALTCFLTIQSKAENPEPNAGLRLSVSVLDGFSGEMIQLIRQTFSLPE